MKLHESAERSIVKSITFRIIVTLVGLVVAYVFTHNIGLTLGITIISNLAATVVYYFHERIWDGIKWGKVSKK